MNYPTPPTSSSSSSSSIEECNNNNNNANSTVFHQEESLRPSSPPPPLPRFIPMHMYRLAHPKKKDPQEKQQSGLTTDNKRLMKIQQLGPWVVSNRGRAFASQSQLMGILLEAFDYNISIRTMGLFISFCFNGGIMLYYSRNERNVISDDMGESPFYITTDENILRECFLRSPENSGSTLSRPSNKAEAKKWFLDYCTLHNFPEPEESAKIKTINQVDYHDVCIKIRRCCQNACVHCVRGSHRTPNRRAPVFKTKFFYCLHLDLDEALEHVYLRACGFILGDM